MRFFKVFYGRPHEDAVPVSLRHPFAKPGRFTATDNNNGNRPGVALAPGNHRREPALRFRKAPDQADFEMREETGVPLSLPQCSREGSTARCASA